MVVVHHQDIDTLLWGAASRKGRSAQADAAALVQWVLVISLGIWQWWEYEHAHAVRVAAYTFALLLYYRSTALFLRFMGLLTVLCVIGDVVLPIKTMVVAGVLDQANAVRVALYMIFVLNNIKMFIAILRSMRAQQSNKGSTRTKGALHALQARQHRTTKAKVA